MGCFVSASLSNGSHVGDRIGTNGSQWAMMALWLAAYALADLPESKRVMRGWIDPYPDWDIVYGNRIYKKAPGMPEDRYGTGRNAKWLRQIVACNHKNRMWLEVIKPRWEPGGRQQLLGLELGIKMKPVKCHKLSALVAMYFRVKASEDNYGVFDPELVKELDPILSEILPHLEPSCWYPAMKKVSEVFTAAAKDGVQVRIG